MHDLGTSGTFAIQQVEFNITDSEDNSVQIKMTFTRNSQARGGQVILKPEILNDSTCSNLIIRNLGKMNDSISASVNDIPRGTYNINIYTLNHNGIPESHAEPVAVREETFSGYTGIKNNSIIKLFSYHKWM